MQAQCEKEDRPEVARLLEIQLADVCDSRIAVHDGYLPLAQRRYASIHSAPSG